MVFQKGVITNPKGNPNPNIRNFPKTGPKTDKGKFRSLMASGLLKTGEHSKLLDKMRKCNRCPLGAKEIEYIVNGKKIVKPIREKCDFYRKNGAKCPIGKVDYIAKMHCYLELEKMGWDESEVAKAITLDAISDANMSKQVEMMIKGHPGFYSNLHSNRALDAIKASHEMKFGKRQIVGLVGDGTGNIIVKKLFEDMDKKKVVEEVVEEVEDEN